MSKASPTKKCRDCGRFKPLADYCKSMHSKDGLNCYCSACRTKKNVVQYERAKRRYRVTVTEKFCTVCKETKPADLFTADRTRKDGLRVLCRACAAEKHKKWHSDPKTWPLRKAIHARWQHGIEPEDYQRMVDSQAGKCAICTEDMGSRPFIDHNHETDEVRDLLCNICNTLLAGLERPGFMEKGLAYLEKHRLIAEAKGPTQKGLPFMPKKFSASN